MTTSTTPANVTTTTIGKYRHLSRCATVNGHFVVLAIDHRANLLDAMNQSAPRPVTDDEFTAFKQQIIGATPASVSAVLTDPAYGIGAGIADRTLPGRLGLLAPIEVTNYDLNPDQRTVEMIPHWSIKKIKLTGGDGVKLLLPYHPEAANATEKHQIVRQIVDDCATYDIPFFLEPIAYSMDAQKPLTDVELRQITLEMAHTFSTMGVDILKLHFPVDVKTTVDEAEWLKVCQEVTTACGGVPWALLSAGVTYEVFLKQARVACAAGASGVIVGRAVWNEAVKLQGEERGSFIQTVMPQRMDELAAICQAHATPWFDRVAEPDHTPTWYEGYGEKQDAKEN
ncbi:MAG TPA: tagatose 1,6-diphosphate aldolase [Phototrophicaceae bacterium]|nr:tagatose 1,6-diphosphate aldolase [Phototrophicaceae bacterium]